jgi:hypothetical protein
MIAGEEAHLDSKRELTSSNTHLSDCPGHRHQLQWPKISINLAFNHKAYAQFVWPLVPSSAISCLAPRSTRNSKRREGKTSVIERVNNLALINTNWIAEVNEWIPLVLCNKVEAALETSFLFLEHEPLTSCHEGMIALSTEFLLALFCKSGQILV